MSDISGNTTESGKKLWEKGQSGNPSGRPKMPDHIRELFRGRLTEASVKVIENILTGVDTDAKPADKIRCAEIVFDRSFGKPVQAVDANVEGSVKFINIGVPSFIADQPEGEDGT